MPNTRTIAYDATFTVLYVGVAAALLAVSLALFSLFMLEFELGLSHVTVAALNLVGWATLPFAPRLYKTLTGHSFTWRANGVLGDEI